MKPNHQIFVKTDPNYFNVQVRGRTNDGKPQFGEDGKTHLLFIGSSESFGLPWCLSW